MGTQLPGPLVIGGVGGSGTRLVAELAERMGFHLGEDLNEQRDNLWFTLLVKGRLWHAVDRGRHRPDIGPALDILEGRLGAHRRLTPSQRLYLRRAVREVSRSGHNHKRKGASGWPRRRAEAILRSSGPPSDAVAWGWKEPNSHVVLPELAARFHDLRYVQVVRHGVDIALRRKEEELHLWGPAFGLTVPTSKKKRTRAKLRYWALANRRAVDLGGELLGERFLLLNYDRLCEDPGAGISRFASFLGHPLDQATLANLVSLPRPVEPRRAAADLSLFAPEDLEAVREFGFEPV